MELILASASPRRKEILSRLIGNFRIVPSFADERLEGDLPPSVAAETLAVRKAESVFSQNPKATVLGADTVVAFEGRILGKPADADDAMRTLRALSGKRHEVFTGGCLLSAERRASGAVCSSVVFRELGEDFIKEYVASGKPLDKAGSYGIQDDRRLVLSYEGSFTNIVGLPEEEIGKQLKLFGLIT